MIIFAHQVPRVPTLKEAHPDCGKHVGGFGYNSRGSFCSGLAGNCGDSGNVIGHWIRVTIPSQSSQRAAVPFLVVFSPLLFLVFSLPVLFKFFLQLTNYRGDLWLMQWLIADLKDFHAGLNVTKSKAFSAVIIMWVGLTYQQ